MGKVGGQCVIVLGVGEMVGEWVGQVIVILQLEIVDCWFVFCLVVFVDWMVVQEYLDFVELVGQGGVFVGNFVIDMVVGDS